MGLFFVPGPDVDHPAVPCASRYRGPVPFLRRTFRSATRAVYRAASDQRRTDGFLAEHLMTYTADGSAGPSFLFADHADSSFAQTLIDRPCRVLHQPLADAATAIKVGLTLEKAVAAIYTAERVLPLPSAPRTPAGLYPCVIVVGAWPEQLVSDVWFHPVSSLHDDPDGHTQAVGEPARRAVTALEHWVAGLIPLDVELDSQV